MEFNPNDPFIQLCIQGMKLQDQNEFNGAAGLFLQAWTKAKNDYDKFIAAWNLAKVQLEVADSLSWYKTALDLAIIVNNEAVSSALPSLHENLAKCYQKLGDSVNAARHDELALASVKQPTDSGPFYHGTRSDLQVGDFLNSGRNSNYQPELVMNHIYFTSQINGAGLAAALSRGEGAERVYIVEPTGSFEDDPNVTNKKFPGNLTRSYLTQHDLKIVGEVKDWLRQTPEQLQQWRMKLVNNKGEIIN